MLTAAKYIGAGLATIGLAGAGVENSIACPPEAKVTGNKLTQNGEVLNNKNENNTVDKKYSKAFLAWLTGFFEGDGCIVCYMDKAKDYKFKFRIRVIIKLSQKVPSVLEDIKKDLGLGNVFLLKKNNNPQISYDLIIANQQDVKTFIELVKPYARFKNKQLEIGLKILQEKKIINSPEDLVKLAKLADSLSVLNTKSGNDGFKYTTMIKEYFNL